MSCDERDQDPELFWFGLVSALHQATADGWHDVRDLLDEDEPELDDVAVATVNELHALESPITIVVDDFQFAHAAGPTFSRIVEALPARVRVVVGSRGDPPLPLHRMRARGQVLELRDDQLRLTPDETREIVTLLGHELGDDSLLVLHERTEGWVAGVHLAAMSLGSADEPRDALRSFSGENRLITEFLAGEVIDRLPEDRQRFLRETSILEELSGPVCQAVTGVADSREILVGLAADNALIVPVGDIDTFRYHRLFRDVLRAQLRASDPEVEAVLHKAAARFYDENGEPLKAAVHFTAAGDKSGVFDLLREHALDIHYREGTAALHEFVELLDLTRAVVDPREAVDIATALTLAGAVTEAFQWLTFAASHGDELHEPHRSRMWAIRAHAFLLGGDPIASADAYSRIDWVDGDPDPIMSAAPTILTRALAYQSDFAGAHAAHPRAMLAAARTPQVAVTENSGMAWTYCVEGRLREAASLALLALQHAESLDGMNHPMVSDALRTLGRLHLERGNFGDAESYLERAIRLSEGIRPVFSVLSYLSLARLYRVQGRMRDAESAVSFARAQVDEGLTGPIADFMNASEAHLTLEAGDPDHAEELAARMGESEQRLRVHTAIALARGDATRARDFLAGSRPATLRQAVDAAVLRARIEHACGGREVNDAVGVVYDLAHEEGFVLALTSDMPELASDVSRLMRGRPAGRFEDAVLELVDGPVMLRESASAGSSVEHLSEREQTVLRYLASRLTAGEIANELFISHNTLKTHVRSVYRKLGVSSRRDALDEAHRRELI
jgi:LuxR family maltose regulon positive regulatory protein